MTHVIRLPERRPVRVPVVARSASDKTDDWPYWMVWDGTANVLPEVCDYLDLSRNIGTVFGSRAACEEIARVFNVAAREEALRR